VRLLLSSPSINQSPSLSGGSALECLVDPAKRGASAVPRPVKGR